MDRNDRDEAIKWLRLGYETFGLNGVAAVTKAIGISDYPTEVGGRRDPTTVGQVSARQSTATGSGDNVFPQGRAGQVRRSAGRAPMACPVTAPKNDPRWRSYDGDPWWFHCDYEGYQEDRRPSPDWPAAECFYDEQGTLVDAGHPYSQCKGTPNSYPASDPRHWLWLDPGGIWNNFGTLGESVRHRYDRNRDWLRRHGYDVPASEPPKAPFPY